MLPAFSTFLPSSYPSSHSVVLHRTCSSFLTTRDNSFHLLRYRRSLPSFQFQSQSQCPSKTTTTIIIQPQASSFTDDFFALPSSPPRPRPLYQVILFSITTNLLWYGFYKYCVEEELLKETGEGLGGFLVLFPFVLGISTPLFTHDGTIIGIGVLSGLAWILIMQYWWLKRVNALTIQKLDKKNSPIQPLWAFIPGLNVIVGLRAIHFLALAFGAKQGEDPVINWFPFLGIENLSVKDLITNPKLWISIGGKNDNDNDNDNNDQSNDSIKVVETKSEKV